MESPLPLPHRQARLRVGSTSPIKLEAVRAAVSRRGYIGLQTDGFPASSEVPEQPVGRGEIRRGALNRALSARKSLLAEEGENPQQPLYGLGIESGLSLLNEEEVRETGAEPDWVEQTLVILLFPDGDTIVEETEKIPVDTQDVEAARNAPGGFACNTAGQMRAARVGGDPKDPIVTLTGGARTRARLIERAVYSVLYHLHDSLSLRTVDLGEEGERGHPVRFSSRSEFVLRLPVRALPDGRRLAYFDCSHPTLTHRGYGRVSGLENLSIEILDKVSGEPGDPGAPCEPYGAVLAPEGKAVMLAWDVAARLNAPLVVARKNNRSVDPAVFSAEYGSVTTTGPQRLHLTESGARALRGQRVLFVDDVVSTGGSMRACCALAALAGADAVVTAALFYETDDLGAPAPNRAPVPLAGGGVLDHYLALLPAPGIL